MITYKIKYKKYIADLYIPNKSSGKIIVLLPGLPKSFNLEKIINVFLHSGCAVIYPNFTGTFDSGGLFDCDESIKDIKFFVNWAKQEEVTELYFGKKIQLGSNNKIILSGVSFGANIALLGCNDSVDKLLLLSPVLLFNNNDINKIIKFNFTGQMKALFLLLKRAYPYSYRIKSVKNLKNFLYGNFYFQSKKNIECVLEKLKIPVFIIHGKNDISIPWYVSYDLKKSIKNSNIIWKFPKVGHSISSYNKNTINLISKFINQK